MLKPTECLVWDGQAFCPVSCEVPILPHGARMMPGAMSPAAITTDALRSYAQAMRMNPLISAYLGAGLQRHGYRAGEDEELYNIMLEYQPDFADAYAPEYHEFDGLGLAFGCEGRRDSIFVNINHRTALKTLFHELFHTVYHNIPGQAVETIESFGNKIREANGVDLSHPDTRSVRWIYSSEEAEAYAFERFATGRPMPFGLKLPSPVRATFQAALRGDYAHHRVRT